MRSVIVAALATSAAAFAPTTSRVHRAATVVKTAEVEPDAMDLDLEQMFEVFDEAVAADGGEPATPVAAMTTSLALPGQPRPAGLNSVSIAGDRGFDPLGFGKDKETILKYRSAEIKHARLAMLAAAGWPLGEVFDKPLAGALNLNSPIVENNGLAPSLLNGGLGLISPAYWVAVIGMAAAVEALGFTLKSEDPGDYGFDPLGLYPKDTAGKLQMQEKEMIHGRVAMVAITAFAAQEFASKVSVVDETPFLFKPLWSYLTENLHSFDLSAGYANY
eukprot:CAMPEP_0119483658 /NCGR_PEP_ID=MMETSP1344-20130328/10966_1 /TAXON_ID=236787 /ORGANISM="Florenciella parvula, Strain CCMP2471" /LENGTH=274 /DNA_ID=CAMNT_0007518167 /DNA_START=71 /DNA_END=895 /DNA_ORIENTATION=-